MVSIAPPSRTSARRRTKRHSAVSSLRLLCATIALLPFIAVYLLFGRESYRDDGPPIPSQRGSTSPTSNAPPNDKSPGADGDAPSFRLVVLAFSKLHSPEALEKTLASVAGADYGAAADDGDGAPRVELDVRVYAPPDAPGGCDELADVARSDRYFNALRRIVVTCHDDGEGELSAWLGALPDPGGGTGGNVLVVDGNVELSPRWYRHVRDSWDAYGGDDGPPDVAGVSLTRQTIGASVRTPLRVFELENENGPYLSPLVIGPAAYSPHPRRWAEFLEWVEAIDLDGMKRRVPNLFAGMFEMKEYDAIFFYHARKVGGSAMKNWLREVANKRGVEFDSLEGDACPNGFYHWGYEALDEVPIYRNRTLSVTILRDPVERALSSYFSEGTAHSGFETAMSLDEWVNYTLLDANGCRKSTPAQKWTYRPNHCWYCATGCYGKWFGWDGSGGGDSGRARRTLNRFDVVLHASDLRNAAYVRTLQRMFNATDVPFAGRRITDAEQKARVNVASEHLDRLAGLNVDDTSLVHHFVGKRSNDGDDVADWYEMFDEETAWTKWTQLFAYWCRRERYFTLHASLPEHKAMAVGHRRRNAPEFGLLTEDDTYDYVFPAHPKKYGWDGFPLG